MASACTGFAMVMTAGLEIHVKRFEPAPTTLQILLLMIDIQESDMARCRPSYAARILPA
jgi:hypothetical protein